jgi:hypothetical protein
VDTNAIKSGANLPKSANINNDILNLLEEDSDYSIIIKNNNFLLNFNELENSK